MTPLQQHIQNWSNCTKCPLHQIRRQVITVRGQIPCEVLFIGEAPGPSEDILGYPFVGPAGHLLDQMIFEARTMRKLRPFRMAFTNLLACIPELDAKNRRMPKKASIDACAPRLEELLGLIDPAPKLVVNVGVIAEKNMPELAVGTAVISIIHPSAILQMQGNSKDQSYNTYAAASARQTAVVTLADALEDV